LTVVLTKPQLEYIVALAVAGKTSKSAVIKYIIDREIKINGGTKSST
jgi:hypothetical protein